MNNYCSTHHYESEPNYILKTEVAQQLARKVNNENFRQDKI